MRLLKQLGLSALVAGAIGIWRRFGAAARRDEPRSGVARRFKSHPSTAIGMRPVTETDLLYLEIVDVDHISSNM